tara:strand:+ start:13 stop:279 length:267 start_codon:yes stop_codon:yes gene_type:complete
MVKNTLIMVSIILLATALFITAYTPEEQIIPEYTSIFTKAICDGKYCQDHIVTCKDKETLSITPTGLVVEFDDNWIDKRPKEMINKIC